MKLVWLFLVPSGSFVLRPLAQRRKISRHQQLVAAPLASSSSSDRNETTEEQQGLSFDQAGADLSTADDEKRMGAMDDYDRNPYVRDTHLVVTQPATHCDGIVVS